MACPKLYWLGPPRIEHGAASVRLGTRKTVALLVYLSLADHPVSRERLAAFFWPDFDPRRAPANLRHSLAAIRAALPGDWLEAERDRIGVRPGADLWVDVRQARRLLAEVKAHAHGADENCPACLARLEKAAGRFQGEFLEDFTLSDCPEFDDWQLAGRESLRLELGWTLERLARAQAAARGWDQALQAARRWVALDRLHTPAQALLIRLLSRTDQRSGAIRQYEEYARLLQDELGQEPEEEMRGLYNRVLAGEREGSGAPPARVPPPRPAGPPQGLLRTKLDVPPLRAARVRRERLIGRITRGLACGVVLVSAPAGFGKSTLLSEWASRRPMPVAWLSLDGGDNDLQRFLAYLCAALSAARDGLGDEAGEMLRSMPPAPAEAVVTCLINAVGSEGADIALVLDDYQSIQTEEIHAAVRLLIDRRPSRLRLLIATREDPPLPMARLRSRGALAEIRADSLRFTLPEAGRFLNSAMALSLSADHVSRLARRTEGWIAGLQMAALSLQGRRDVDGFVTTFGGTHRYILDYLAEEVLGRQTPAVARFLLETSVLERLCAPLCDAVTGRRDSHSMLVRLESANLFISPMDDERRWYRYHQLFAAILRHQLAGSGAERVSRLHRRAGAWYEQEGLTEEAIDHSLLGGDPARAADLLEGFAPRLLAQGWALRLLDHLPRLPEPLVSARPWLCVSFAWAALLTGKWEILSAMLSRVETPAGRPDLRRIRGHTLAIQAYVAQARGDIARSIRLAEEAGLEIAADDLLTRSANSINLAIDYLITGDLARAAPFFEEAEEIGLRSGNRATVLSSRAYLSEIEMQRSRFDRAARICTETIGQGLAWGGARPLPYTAPAHIVLGQVKYEQDDLPGAAGDLTEGIRLAEANCNWTFVLKGCLLMARLSQSQGRPDAALEYIRRAAEAAPRAPQARECRQVPSWKARIDLRRGDIAAAAEWGRQQEPSLPLSRLPDCRQEHAYLTLIRLGLAKLARGECQELPGYLDGFIRQAERQARSLAVAEALILQALALDRLGRPAAAVETLARVLALAEPAGLARAFIDEGAPMAGLLRRTAAAGRCADHASRLLDRMTPRSADRPVP